MRIMDVFTRVAVLITALTALPASASEYRLQRGDTLSISVANLPSFERKATIGVDGMVVFPLTDPIRAAGRTLSEVTGEARDQISKQAVKIHGQDRDYTVVIATSDIAIDVAEYRPIYVRGDIAKPGELVYRPGMTVRQVVALAGGYDLVRYRLDNPFMQASDLRAEYDSIWVDYARAEVHLAVLKASMEDKPATEFPAGPIPAAVMQEIVRLEIEQAAAEREDYARERDYLSRSAESAAHSADTIGDQQEKTQFGLELQNEEMMKIKNLATKGFTPSTRVNQEQSMSLALSGQVAESIVKKTEMKHSREEFLRMAGRLESQRKISFSKDMEETSIRLADIADKIQSVGEKLKFAGQLRLDDDYGEPGSARIVIYRVADGAESKMEVQEAREVSPGDTVDIRLDRQKFLGDRPAHVLDPNIRN